MFEILTFVFIIVSLIAITKAVRYETQIKKIRRSTRALFDDLESGRIETKSEVLDTLIRDIDHDLNG